MLCCVILVFCCDVCSCSCCCCRSRSGSKASLALCRCEQVTAAVVEQVTAAVVADYGLAVCQHILPLLSVRGVHSMHAPCNMRLCCPVQHQQHTHAMLLTACMHPLFSLTPTTTHIHTCALSPAHTTYTGRRSDAATPTTHGSSNSRLRWSAGEFSCAGRHWAAAYACMWLLKGTVSFARAADLCSPRCRVEKCSCGTVTPADAHAMACLLCCSVLLLFFPPSPTTTCLCLKMGPPPAGPPPPPPPRTSCAGYSGESLCTCVHAYYLLWYVHRLSRLRVWLGCNTRLSAGQRAPLTAASTVWHRFLLHPVAVLLTTCCTPAHAASTSHSHNSRSCKLQWRAGRPAAAGVYAAPGPAATSILRQLGWLPAAGQTPQRRPQQQQQRPVAAPVSRATAPGPAHTPWRPADLLWRWFTGSSRVRQPAAAAATQPLHGGSPPPRGPSACAQPQCWGRAVWGRGRQWLALGTVGWGSGQHRTTCECTAAAGE